MSKKDYDKAALIAQDFARFGPDSELTGRAVRDAFTRLFTADGNPRFDAARFLRACLPGANVRARA